MKVVPSEQVLAALRILAGLLAASHGVRKLVVGPVRAIGSSLEAHGFPESFAYVVTAGELAGFLMALGLFTRWSALAVGATMLGIVLFVQRALVAQVGTGKAVAFEYPLLLAAVAFAVALSPRGPGLALKRR